MKNNVPYNYSPDTITSFHIIITVSLRLNMALNTFSVEVAQHGLN